MRTSSLARVAIALLFVGIISIGPYSLIHNDFILGAGAVGFLIVLVLLIPIAKKSSRG